MEVCPPSQNVDFYGISMHGIGAYAITRTKSLSLYMYWESFNTGNKFKWIAFFPVQDKENT